MGWFTFANCLVLFKGKSSEDGKRWIKFLLDNERYSRFWRSIPGAMMPATKAVNESKDFWEHPFFVKHREEVRILQEGVASGSFPGASQGLHANLRLLVQSEALWRMLERIVKEDADVEKAVAQAHRELEADLAKIKARREEPTKKR